MWKSCIGIVHLLLYIYLEYFALQIDRQTWLLVTLILYKKKQTLCGNDVWLSANHWVQIKTNKSCSLDDKLLLKMFPQNWEEKRIVKSLQMKKNIRETIFEGFLGAHRKTPPYRGKSYYLRFFCNLIFRKLNISIVWKLLSPWKSLDGSRLFKFYI